MTSPIGFLVDSLGQPTKNTVLTPQQVAAGATSVVAVTPSGMVDGAGNTPVGGFSAALQIVSITSVTDGATNLSAINTKLSAGGDVVIPPSLGTVTVGALGGTHTMVMPSGTSLTVGIGTTLKSADGRRQPFLRNKFCGIIRAAATLTRASNVVTVNDPGHMYAVGDQFIVVNGPDSSFAGLATVAAVTISNWTYTSTGSNGIAGTTAQFYDFIPVRQALAAASFSGATGLVRVSEVGHTKRPGMQIYMGSVGASAFAPNVIVQVAKVSLDFWWYYIGVANGTPAEPIYLSWDTSIKITGGGIIDGNRIGAAAPPVGNEALNSVALLGCVTGLYADSAVGGSSIRGFQTCNCDEVFVGPNWRGFDCLVAWQAEGGARSFVVDQTVKGTSTFWTSLGESATGQQCDDYVAFTGVKRGVGGIYDNVTSPYGFTAFDDIDIRRINPVNALNGVKITAHSTCPFTGVFRVGRVNGKFLDTIPKLTTGYGVQVFDDGVSLTGVALDVLKIDGPIDWRPASNAGGAVSLSGTGTANAVFVKAVNSTTANAINTLYFGGFTAKLMDVSASSFQPVANSIQLNSGTIRKLRVAASRARIDTGKPLILLNGATVSEIEIDSLLISSATSLGGFLIDVIAAPSTTKITFRGIKTETGSLAISSLMRLGDFAYGTVDVHLSDIDMASGSLLSSIATGLTGTFNIFMDKSVKWSPGGGSNAIQVGGGLWNIFGEPGTQITADKLALFGFGTPTYRIHMPSANATININGANYSGAQVVPVNGDIIYNNNAGAITVGLALRVLAGAWRVL